MPTLATPGSTTVATARGSARGSAIATSGATIATARHNHAASAARA